MDNALLRAIMRRDNVSKDEAIEICVEEYIDSGKNFEDALYNLGFEPDYVFDFFNIVASR